MDYFAAISAQLLSRKGQVPYGRSGEDAYYEQYGFDHFSGAKKALKNLRIGTAAFSNFWMRTGNLVQHDA